MSDQFYNYLADKIYKFFNTIQIKNGDRFDIQLETEKQVNELYSALRKLKNTQPFAYQGEYTLYETFSIEHNGIHIIVAATINNITIDFLDTLRNKVVTYEDKFSNTAILFIHNTNLDSIIKGAGSFHKEGMPFHPRSLEQEIKEELAKGDLSQVDQWIINFVLSKKKKNLFEDQTTLFEYQEIFETISNKKITLKQYKKFRLFPDEGLVTLTEKEANNRLEANYDLFSKVYTVHQYGNPEQDLEKSFDTKGVSVLSRENWMETPFKKVWDASENNKKVQPLLYLPDSKGLSLEGVKYWERPNGGTKAQQRIRNIIIFNKDQLTDIKLELSFDQYLKSQYLKVPRSTNNIEVHTSGKKLKIKIYTEKNNYSFNRVIYKENEKYEFRIMSIECDEVLLNQFKACYSLPSKMKDPRIILNSEEDQLKFNSKGAEYKIIVLEDELTEVLLSDPSQQIILVKDKDYIDDENEFLRVDLRYINTFIPLSITQPIEKPKPITGLQVSKLKRQRQVSFEYYPKTKKLIQGNQQYYAREEFRKNVEIEDEIIQSGAMFFKINYQELCSEKLEVDSTIQVIYDDLISYYKVNGVLPSLAYMDEELMKLSRTYVRAFIRLIQEIENDVPLQQPQKNLMKVGTIERVDGTKEIMFTPLHPLNVAYQIMLNNSTGQEEIDDQILKRLAPSNLLPYIENQQQKLYKPVEQKHSPEWLYYINNELPRYHGSKDFVGKLVCEKIKEFVDHFSYLFSLALSSPIKINLINMGDCREILQGIFDYYCSELKDRDIYDILPMDIHIYREKGNTNVFEELSLYDDVEKIKNEFGISLESKDYNERDVLNIFREKVKFYSIDYRDQQIAYSHITFYQMKQDVEKTYANMRDINTGISLEGLMSGIPSVHIHNTYRTGFGTKYLSHSPNLLLQLAIGLNAVARTARNINPYKDGECIITAISEESKEKLDIIYNKSHWITFIDPKVDLSFFKNDEKAKDLLIIHYSDQYTSSSGYDAITVTRKSRQYQAIIEDFLRQKKIKDVEIHSPKVINIFNAVNGDWLLRLISQKSQFPREKLSIISAIKLSLGYFYHEDIIWVPVSLEEILRVSGATGLKSNLGLFKLAKKGSFSDDILLIGVEWKSNPIRIHYYPIEVKIGLNHTNVINKGSEQGRKTKELIEESLIGNKFINRFYRNFLIQLTIVSAEKMKLYNIWDKQDWDKIINSEVREKLLNDQYEICNRLDSFIGKYAVISFKSETYFRSRRPNNSGLLLEFTETDGFNNITSSVEELKDYFRSKESDFNPAELLGNLYIPSETQYKQNEEDLNNTTESLGKVVDPENELGYKEKKEEENNKFTEIAKPMEIIFGKDQIGNSIKWYPTATDKLMHTNTGIIGTMGTGKTQFTKSLITQLHANTNQNVKGADIGILIFDYKGDYIKDDFVEATNAKVYDLFHLPYNPLALFQTERTKNLLPLHTANNLKDTIAKAFGLGPVQQNTLKEVTMEAYERRGIHKSDRATWDKLPPTIHDIFRIYCNQENVKVDSLYSGLSELTEFEIFEPESKDTKSLFKVIDGITVINLSGYDESIQNLVVAITLDIFYSQMQMEGHSAIQGNYRQIKKMILVDEADNFLSKDFKSLRKILKEGREFGVGTILSTQFLDHFSTADNDYANYILTWVVHNVSDISNKDIRYIFNTTSKSEEENIVNKIKQLEKHYSIVNQGEGNKPIMIRDLAFWELIKRR